MFKTKTPKANISLACDGFDWPFRIPGVDVTPSKCVGHRNKGKSEVILSSEMQAEIKRFRKEERQTRKKLREVRKVLRQDIESLGTKLTVLNMLAVPFIIGIIGFFFYRSRMLARSNQGTS